MAAARKKTNRIARVLLWILVVVLLVGAIYLVIGWFSYQESPKTITIKKPLGQLVEPYQLSSTQTETLYARGYPEAFTILFYEEIGQDGIPQAVRLENWDYYTQGIGLTFINGTLASEQPIEAGTIPPADPLPYSPEQFGAFMSLEEVIAAAGIETYLEIPLDRELMEEGALYYAPGLAFGIQEDELRYLEVFAVASAGTP